MDLSAIDLVTLGDGGIDAIQTYFIIKIYQYLRALENRTNVLEVHGELDKLQKKLKALNQSADNGELKNSTGLL